MKKLLLVVILLVVAFLIYRYAFKKDEPKEEAPKGLAVSVHSEAFNASVDAVLKNYFAMTEGFVNWDSTVVNKGAANMLESVNNLALEDLKKDSMIYQTALFPVENLKSNAAAISGENDWAAKRYALRDLSDNLRNFLITVKYDAEPVYWQECPMAFGEGNSGSWLSDKEAIVNPYLGKKDPKYGATMLACGETKQKIDFTVPDTTQQQ
ncbi:DUF3347 domain-containing protein [Niabella ginsengisoli]|uniref:DUF3347 domain-containing protein n=1 Tax=Niabella ginsengisoli TaxID=522298 RepID=A0ABS9SJU3_9BACT|nr:DUF3347 domain-containing protein [Niabella ginsengisoli]MCH5598566.1 DUF3347 domain-containing protein [Niabella ginsengisoli]